MVRAAAAFLIQLPETFKVQALNQSVNHPNWIMLCNILVNSLRKKHCLVGIIRTKMYLCHSENLMPKDTKSLVHPTRDALLRLTDAGVSVYRTDLQGNIYITVN